MDPVVTRTLEVLVMPPGGPLLLAAFSLLWWRRRPRAALLGVVLGIALLWVATLPVTGHALLHALEREPPLTDATARAARAQAIVVLGAGRYSAAPEYGGADTASRYGLERLRYGARLQRVTGLPVLVTGGSVVPGSEPEARFMARVLREDFGAGEVWLEEASRTTRENAQLSAELLRRRGITRVLLVTHAWHMPRSLESFRRAGLDPIAAPTGFAEEIPFPRNGLPDAQSGLEQTRLALHEWLGRLVYALPTKDRGQL